MLRLELDHTPAVVATARRRACAEVRSRLPGLVGLDTLADDVALVVSELVTNSLVHGEPPVVLEVAVKDRPGGHLVIVTCIDAGPWDGTPPDPIRGRGLLLVRALAEAVIDAKPAGTRVSATLTC